MDTIEVTIRKKQMEDFILKKISHFEETTGTRVASVQLQTEYTLDGQTRTVSASCEVHL
jgi:hypothetical protein